MAALALCALALGSCARRESATPCLSADLFALAARHYRLHNPAQLLSPSSRRLSYAIEDSGDHWEIWVGRSGYVGGGQLMLVRKSDMRVEVQPIRSQ